MIAAKNGHVECTELLLQAGANPVLMNAMGKKALHLATIANRAHIVRLLRTHGVNLNQLTDQRHTPLCFGCLPQQYRGGSRTA
jgi:ankyrin repeat protein